MKALLSIILMLATVLLLFVLSGQLLIGQKWWLLGLMLLSVFVLFFILIRNLAKQADENPYYADMVREKRDWVRMKRLESTK